MAGIGQTREINDETWDHKEFEWTGKSFYFLNCTFILGNPVGLDGKLEQLNRDVRNAGYKVKNPMTLVEIGKFSGKVMIEVEKKDLYDAQVMTYDVPTTCDTIVHYGGRANLGKGISRIKERVAARRSMDPRQIFYLFLPDASAKTIIFAVT